MLGSARKIYRVGGRERAHVPKEVQSKSISCPRAIVWRDDDICTRLAQSTELVEVTGTLQRDLHPME